MSDKLHADVSPSGAPRWMVCTPSVRLEKLFKGLVDEESEYAREGTLAHKFAECIFAQRFNTLPPSKVLVMLQEVQSDVMYNKQMRDYVYEYVDYVTEIYNEVRAKDPTAILLIEERIDVSMIVPEGFGHGDAIIIGDNCMYYFDLKYGMGVPVEAENNEQAMLYVYGLWDKYSHIYDIGYCQIHIFQPRINNTNDISYYVEEIIEWAENVCKPLAIKAFKGAGEFIAGEHCKFCKALHSCRKAAEHNLSIVSEEYRDPELLSPHEIVDILVRKAEFMSWIKAVSDYAAAQARRGVKYPGMKLVNGKADRVYANEEKVLQTLLAKGYTKKDLYNVSLKGIGDMEKLLGKAKFEAYLNGLVIKPTGAPSLVPVTDKRPEIGSAASAMKDFS